MHISREHADHKVHEDHGRNEPEPTECPKQLASEYLPRTERRREQDFPRPGFAFACVRAAGHEHGLEHHRGRADQRQRGVQPFVLQSRLGETGDTLRQLKNALTQRNLLLILDEVERLAEPDFNPRLHDLLRALAQEQHFALCLASQRPLVDVFPARTANGLSPFHNIFVEKTLGPFTEPEARLFLAQRLLDTAVQFTPTEIDNLLRQSQCHPAQLQRLAKLLFDRYVN